MNMNFLSKIPTRLVTDNAPTILTGVAVVGTAATAVLSVRGAFKAADKINGENISRHRLSDDWDEAVLLTTKESVKLVWMDFIPAAGAAGVSIAAVVCANKITAGRIAAMTAAYSLSETKLKDYKTALEEKMGVKKKEEVDEHFNKQRVEQAASVERPAQRPIIISGDTQLFFDIYSGRHFEASMEDLRSAENDMHYKVIQEMECPLSYFYETIGLPSIAMGDDWGWNANCPPEFKYSPAIDDKTGKAVIWVDFDVEPLRRWNHLDSRA